MGVHNTPWKGAVLGKRVDHCKKNEDFMPSVVQKRLNRSRCRLGCGLGWAEWSTRSIIFARWRQCAQSSGATVLDDTLPWAVEKRLNRSICRLGCGFGCAEGSASSIVFAKWRQCAQVGGHINATWRIRLKRPSAAAMRSYVKLRWPLVIIMVALCNRADHYIFALWFLSIFFFFFLFFLA